MLRETGRLVEGLEGKKNSGLDLSSSLEKPLTDLARLLSLRVCVLEGGRERKREGKREGEREKREWKVGGEEEEGEGEGGRERGRGRKEAEGKREKQTGRKKETEGDRDIQTEMTDRQR